MDSSRDCSYTINGALPPQTQITSAETKAAGTLQIGYYDLNNPRKAKFKHHLTSDGAIDSRQAMLRTAQMDGRHYRLQGTSHTTERVVSVWK